MRILQRLALNNRSLAIAHNPSDEDGTALPVSVAPLQYRIILIGDSIV